MPELPDLVRIRSYLRDNAAGRSVTAAAVQQPVVLRIGLPGRFEEALAGATIRTVDLRGPFLRIVLSGHLELVLHLMLAGLLQHQRPGERPEPHSCCALTLDDGSVLRVCDRRKMAKVYLVREGAYGAIPKFATQGVDILSPAFTAGAFRALVRRNARRQVRVFVNDQSALSAIGNAYADEVLFDAGVHPKTLVGSMGPEATDALYASIRRVMAWGIAEVAAAGKPIHAKVRDHLRVRNRGGKPCVRCGTLVRREGVRGYDVFFCPSCQPATRKLFLDWRRIPPGPPPAAGGQRDCD